MRVQVRDIAKHFHAAPGGPSGLGPVGFDLAEGEFVAVVGPSGCGKTTLLNIIAGLTPADSGQVAFSEAAGDGRPLTSMVFQELALFPWRTVEGNVRYGLEELGLPRRERGEIAARCLRLVRLGGCERHYPHQLSGGMKQRAAIARALAVNPWLLLMDEPFSALDAQTRMSMQLELARIHQETGQSVLYVTHYIPEAVFLADRVIVLAGRPGVIRRQIVIELERPRREKVKVDPRYVAYLDEIWSLLGQGGGA